MISNYWHYALLGGFLALAVLLARVKTQVEVQSQMLQAQSETINILIKGVFKKRPVVRGERARHKKRRR